MVFSGKASHRLVLPQKAPDDGKAQESAASGDQ